MSHSPIFELILSILSLVLAIEFQIKCFIFVFFKKLYVISVFTIGLVILDLFDRSGKRRRMFLEVNYPAFMKQFALLFLIITSLSPFPLIYIIVQITRGMM